MFARVADQQDREQRAHDRIADPEIDRCRSKTILRSEIAGEECSYADGEITGELIETDRKAACLGSDQIDLHNHRHRPGKSLIDAEQGIGGNDPTPAWRPDDHEGHRQSDEPAENEYTLAAPAIGELTGDKIGERFDHAEADDEGCDDCRRGNAELF